MSFLLQVCIINKNIPDFCRNSQTTYELELIVNCGIIFSCLSQLESPAARPRSSLSGSFLSTLRSPSIAAKLDPDPTSFAVQTASLEEASEKEKRKHKEKLFKAIIEGDIQLVRDDPQLE